MGDNLDAPTFLDQWLQKFSSFRKGASSGRSRQLVLVASASVFAVFAVFAFRALSNQLGSANWTLIILASGFGTVVSQFLNSLEFREIGRSTGAEFSVSEAFQISLAGSAANLLPIPGSVAVRMAAISKRGVRISNSARASVAVGGYFLSVTMLISGCFLLFLERTNASAALCVLGLIGITASAFLLNRLSPRNPSLHVRVTCIEGMLVLIGGLRLTLTLTGLGFDVAFSQGVGLMVAGALTTAVGFFPAGLGLREALMAAISPAVGLDPAAGVAGSIVDRVFRLGILAAASAFLALASRRTSEGVLTDE